MFLAQAAGRGGRADIVVGPQQEFGAACDDQCKAHGNHGLLHGATSAVEPGTLPQCIGKGRAMLVAGSVVALATCVPSQAERAPTSSFDRRSAICAMQSGAWARRTPFFQAPNCALI